jgi:uncharacterized membrane protein YhhN
MYWMDGIIEMICKPLLMIILLALFISETRSVPGSLKKWIIGALFFSWIGDIVLMFQEKDKLYFLLGLSSFLLAHVCYIIFFHLVRIREGIKSNVWFLLLIVTYYALLISILSPSLGDMKLPVRIYGIVISFMLMLALHMLFLKHRTAGLWMLAGALLFVISDSALALNKFYNPFPYSGATIMLTYGLAQLFIINGAFRYIRYGVKR